MFTSSWRIVHFSVSTEHSNLWSCPLYLQIQVLVCINEEEDEIVTMESKNSIKFALKLKILINSELPWKVKFEEATLPSFSQFISGYLLQ